MHREDICGTREKLENLHIEIEVEVIEIGRGQSILKYEVVTAIQDLWRGNSTWADGLHTELHVYLNHVYVGE